VSHSTYVATVGVREGDIKDALAMFYERKSRILSITLRPSSQPYIHLPSIPHIATAILTSVSGVSPPSPPPPPVEIYEKDQRLRKTGGKIHTFKNITGGDKSNFECENLNELARTFTSPVRPVISVFVSRSVCLLVCLPVRLHISKTNFTKFSVCYLGPTLTAMR